MSDSLYMEFSETYTLSVLIVTFLKVHTGIGCHWVKMVLPLAGNFGLFYAVYSFGRVQWFPKRENTYVDNYSENQPWK